MIADQEHKESKRWGRIFIGTNDSDIRQVELERSTAWTERDEESYLTRVRGKAEQKAKQILSEAEGAAQALREQAREAGYAEGLSQSAKELDELRASMADSTSAVLASIEGQCASIFATWRDELTALLRASVEKSLGLELTSERAKILESLYTQAVQALESHRTLIVTVSPEDEAAVSDIIRNTQERYPELKSWKVRGDKSITPGGLLVESESSLADNRIESRKAALESVLAALTLPAD